MIKNIVFDVGKVLVDFNWQNVFTELGFTEEKYHKVAQATVLSSLWNEFDRGAMAEEDILRGFLDNEPECHDEIQRFWESTGKTIKQYDYSRDWIKSLKEKGYQIYILSNYPERVYHLTRNELDFVDLADGGIFSYQIKHIKPEPEIYQALFEKYNLEPEECLFLDDNEKNVIAARELGMQAIQFKDKMQAEQEMKILGIR